MGEDVVSNKQSLIDFAIEHGMLLANTFFHETSAHPPTFKQRKIIQEDHSGLGQCTKP